MRDVGLSDLMHRHRVADALEAIRTMVLPCQRAAAGGQLDFSALGELACNRRHQNLTRQRQRHQPRRDRLGQALDIDRFGSRRDLFRAVFPQHHLADMDTDAGGELGALQLRQFLQAPLVLERKPDCLHRPLEQQQKSVSLVDLAPTMPAQQVARQAIMPAHQLSRALVAQPVDQCRAVRQVEQQQRAQRRAGRWQGADRRYGGRWRRTWLRLTRTPRRRGQHAQRRSRLRASASARRNQAPARISTRSGQAVCGASNLSK
jgi:hypothetical protein